MALRILLLATCLYLYLSLPVTDARFVGCYRDGNPRDLSLMVHLAKNMNRRHCGHYCFYKGYKYAGMQSGEWCGCGNFFGRYGRAPIRECRTHPCASRRTGLAALFYPNRSCGGRMRSLIFSTGIRRPAKRIGCYYEKRRNRDLPKLRNFGNRMSRNRCIRYCKRRRYKYAGLMAGKYCSCGNSYGRYGKAPDLQCNVWCAGARKQTCGGVWRNDIYKTR